MAAEDQVAREGFAAVPGGNVWYRIVGDGDAIPLLTLHGGPGAEHGYLEPLAGIADERPVVFFDQLGCGRSDRPDDPSLWRMERFVAEIDALREALGLDRVHLLGHSWGGWLAVEYLLSAPRGVESLVLASTSASIPQFVAEAERLKDTLPPDVRDTLRRFEAAGDFTHPAYLAAVDVFYHHFLCRLDPWPEELAESVGGLADNQVYATMNGPNEFIVTGNLKDWNRIDRLGEIRVPTLITVGRYDELTPACAATLRDGIAGSRMVVFEQSAHLSHQEETDAYLDTLRGFLRRVEGRG